MNFKYSSQCSWQPKLRIGQSLHGACNDFQCLLYAVCDTGNRACVLHRFQKSPLIVPRLFPGEFHFDVDGSSIGNTVTHDVGFTVFSDVDDTAVLREELPDRVITGHAAVLTEGRDDFVL